MRLHESAQAQEFDVLATDHCPFHREYKDQWRTDIRRIPNGVAGLGALTHMAAALFGSSWTEQIPKMVAMLSENPARITGLYPRKGVIRKDSDADLVILAPARFERPIRSSLGDVHETFPDQFTRLDIRSVLLAGREIVRNNELLPQTRPEGRFVYTLPVQ